MAHFIKKEREETVRKIINQVGDLPAAPAILEKAVNLTSDLDSSISDISQSVALDQTISANVIRVANSPLFARKAQVTCLHEAIQVLGFDEVKSIVITAVTFKIFGNCDHADIAMKLWHHSLSTAIASRMIADRLTGLNKDDAYLAGLMHDIGKLILLNLAPSAFTNIIESAKVFHTEFVDQEERDLGFNHADLGAVLLEKWLLPNEVVKAVARHHKCSLRKPAPLERLERVVCLADSVSKYIGTDFQDPYVMVFEDEFYIGPSKIEGDNLIMIQCDTESQFNSQMSLLYH